MQLSTESLQARVLIELSPAFLHTLKDYTRTMDYKGLVRLAALDTESGAVTFMNIDNIQQVLTKMNLFFKVEYKKSVSYVFARNEGLQAVSISKAAGEPLNAFEKILEESATLLTYNQALAHPQLVPLIEANCPQLEFAEILHEDEKVVETIDNFGTKVNGAMRKFGKWAGNGIARIGGFNVQEVEAAPQRSQAVQAIYNMGDNGGRLIAPVTNKVSGWIDPLLERGRNGVRQLGNKFEAIGPKAEYSSRVIQSTGNAVGQSCYGCFFAFKVIGSTTWAQIVGKLNKKNEAEANKEILALDETPVNMEKGLLEKTTPQEK